MIGNTGPDDQHAWLVARWNFYLHRSFDEHFLVQWMNYLAANGSLRTEQAIAGSPEAEMRKGQMLNLLNAQGGNNPNVTPPSAGAGAGELGPLPADVPKLEGPPPTPPASGGIVPPHVVDGQTGVVVPIVPADPFPWEPGSRTSELKLALAWLAGHGAIVVAIFAQLGVHLSPDQVAEVVKWIGAETGLVTTAYAALRTYRKVKA